jgi:cation-transporting ATPase I
MQELYMPCTGYDKLASTVRTFQNGYSQGDKAMSVAVAEGPRVLHTLPGRIRVHLPEWSGQGRRAIEATLRQIQGVQGVQANALTGNILIYFDPLLTDEQSVLSVLHGIDLDKSAAPEYEAPPPPVVREKQGKIIRARIPVRGLDRDPHLARHVLEHLESRPGVRARVSMLTGRILVEFSEHEASLDDLISEITGLELPELPDEDRPAYPLDAGPWVRGLTRSIGAGLGLSLFAIRRIAGFTQPLPGAGLALEIASIIGIVQGAPPVRSGLRKLFGHTLADLLLIVPGVVALTFAESPLGLTLAGCEALRLLTENSARRTAWKRYTESAANKPSFQPDALVHLDAGDRVPLAASVVEGTGIAIGRDGFPVPVTQGTSLPSGVQLYGGPFALKLQVEKTFQAFQPEPRPAPLAPSLYDRYQQLLGPVSLVYAGLTALLTRSFRQTLAALMLVNPRAAIIGQHGADLGASARVLREGVTVVGTRPERTIQLPNLVLLDGVRLLTDGLEISDAQLLVEDRQACELQQLAAQVSAAAGSPWGKIFKNGVGAAAVDGHFDGSTASASIDGVQYMLGPVEDWSLLPAAAHLRQKGHYVLLLRQLTAETALSLPAELDGRADEQRPLLALALQSRLAPGITELVQTCQRYGVKIAALAGGDELFMQALARRTGIPLIEESDQGRNAIDIIRARQQRGGLVAFVSDNASAAAAFEACDLAIGMIDSRSHVAARVDLLAPNLTAVAAIIEAGARRKASVRDSVWLSLLSNIVGAVWGLQGMPGLELASRTTYIAALSTLSDGWLRLRGARYPVSTTPNIVDPHPERWGRLSIEEVMQHLNSRASGLSSAEVSKRRQQITQLRWSHNLGTTLLNQVRSPLIGILAVGAGISLLLGATADVVLIGVTIMANVAFSAWQEHKANTVALALQRLGSSTARVLRNGQASEIAANEIVPGDILLLAPGDRVAADTRLIEARGLEVDESALTGESLPVPKLAVGGSETDRILLEGSDVITGTAKAIVVATGRQTRMGATAAALVTNGTEQSPLGVRLTQMLRVILPVSLVGGIAVIGSGLFWKQPLAALLATGVSIALAGVPEGLPLLTKVGEAGVASRLAGRNALVRRLSAVEALGRVNIVCADKTGTLTKGRLALSLVANTEKEMKVPGKLPADLRHVLLTAALASPHPEAQDVRSHPTDIAVIQGAVDAGLEKKLRVQHEAEASFDPLRSFHATLAQQTLSVKGAPEALLSRCSWQLLDGERQPLDEAGRQTLLSRSRQLAERGLRVLLVAEGSPDCPIDDPTALTFLGFVGISDAPRSTAQTAVRRCQDAGVRVMMITGDHPATARTIAQEVGLLNGGTVLTGVEMAELSNDELAARLEHASVIARATPLDKLRIIESLRMRGHTVAMTGDGVNDAPALRLADVGVAMGGTEVARQTADVVITDDNFSTLVETFVEGRSFWRNVRRALGLLLGGNLGELALVVSASLLGFGSPLNARQILAMNAITDTLPALAVALQQPEHRNLAGLNREGAAALDTPLCYDILRRAVTSAAPALLSYLILLSSGVPQARTAAYASIVATQLAQTLDVGRYEGGLTRSVFAAVVCSAAVLIATLTVPPLRSFLNLVAPSPLSWMLIGAGALIAVVINRLLSPMINSMLTSSIPTAPAVAPA